MHLCYRKSCYAKIKIAWELWQRKNKENFDSLKEEFEMLMCEVSETQKECDSARLIREKYKPCSRNVEVDTIELP